MRSTFKTVFYVNGSKEKNGIVPIMGRVTINGTIAQFSCKQRISKDLWDAKGNRAKGKSREAVTVNYALDNIKAQITKHYQRLSDREAFVTAEMVRNAYQGIGSLDMVNKRIKAVAKKCGIEKPVSFHLSRHSFAVLALNYGMPIESVSKILGHTNITTMQIYAKVTNAKLENDISAFESKISGRFVL